MPSSKEKRKEIGQITPPHRPRVRSRRLHPLEPHILRSEPIAEPHVLGVQKVVPPDTDPQEPQATVAGLIQQRIRLLVRLLVEGRDGAECADVGEPIEVVETCVQRLTASHREPRDRAADEALRSATYSLQGKLLVGVINSLGVRRDPIPV